MLSSVRNAENLNVHLAIYIVLRSIFHTPSEFLTIGSSTRYLCCSSSRDLTFDYSMSQRRTFSVTDEQLLPRSSWIISSRALAPLIMIERLNNNNNILVTSWYFLLVTSFFFCSQFGTFSFISKTFCSLGSHKPEWNESLNIYIEEVGFTSLFAIAKKSSTSACSSKLQLFIGCLIWSLTF